MTIVSNLELMKTLDDAWNAQDWEEFRQRHSSDTAVYWPGQPDRHATPPACGRWYAYGLRSAPSSTNDTAF